MASGAAVCLAAVAILAGSGHAGPAPSQGTTATPRTSAVAARPGARAAASSVPAPTRSGPGSSATEPVGTPGASASSPTPSALPASSGAASSPPPVNVYAAITGGLDARVATIPARVYVPDEASGTVVVIDPSTFKIVDRYVVGRLPHHVTPSWDLSTLYVNNMESSRLTEISPVTGKPIGSRAVPNPYNLYFTPDGSKAIVVAEPRNRLDFYDRRTWRLLKHVPIPHAGPNHLDFSADGRYLIVSTEFAGYLVKVDTVRMRVSSSLRVGGQPVDVKLSPDGTVFYNANMKRDGVSVIDPVRMREIAFLHTGNEAHGLAISRDTTRLYVTNRRSGTISVIDFASRRVVATWKVGFSPDMISISPDGRQLWTSDRFDGRVSVVNTVTGRVIKVIRVDVAPHGLTYFPQPGHISLGHNGVYR